MKYSLARFYAGFTLIEMLAVVTIIAILATLSLSAIRGAQIRSRDSQRKADLNLIAQGLESYYADQRVLPGVVGGVCQSFSSQVGGVWIPGLDSYIPSTAGKANRVPIDPKNSSPYFYTYQCSGNGTAASYTLKASLENTNDSDSVGGVYTVAR